MNSICSEMIQSLYSGYGQEILAYIKSRKFIDDLIKKNKSTTNKLFYLLHLDAIIFDTERGKIHEFPFFQLDQLSEQIRRVVRVLRIKFNEEKELKADQRVEKVSELPYSRLP